MGFRERRQGVFAGPNCCHLHVLLAADEIGNRLALRVVVFDEQQALDGTLDERADVTEGVEQGLFRDRLLEERHRAGLQRVLPAVPGGDDVHRDVPGLGMVLQAVEHAPTVHDRQPHVEHDRVGFELVREREP